MKKLITICAIAFGLLAAPVSAATIDVYGYVSEGPNILDGDGTLVSQTGAGHVTPDFALGDFNTAVTDPTLSFSGEAWIFGWIDQCCFDGFSIAMDNYSYTLQFSVLDAVPDHKWIGVEVGGTDYGNINQYSSLLEVDVTGSTFVQLDGNRSGNAYWLIDVVNIEPVPLPASSLLLLGGLGGLAAMRRRKKA